MTAFRRLSGLVTRASAAASLSSFLKSANQCQRSYSAAALAVAPDIDEWELPIPVPIPVLQDTHGQHRRRCPQLIFLGSPCVDKGAYANRLAKLLNVPHLSMGNLLRKEAASSSTFSKELASLMVRGKLLPDDLIFSILSKRLAHNTGFVQSGFVLDGFPRTITQAEVLDQIVDVDMVIHMKLRIDMMVKCLEGGICSECGRTFSGPPLNMETAFKGQVLPDPHSIMKEMVPSLGDTCCTLRKRLNAYSLQYKPVESHYRKQGKLLDFEVQGGLPHTWRRLLSALHIQDKEVVMYRRIPPSVLCPALV